MVFRAGTVDLPSPTSLTVDDEIIWSSDTGRTLAGQMVGDVVAEKKKLSIGWEYLPEQEVKLIKDNLVSGFFPFTFHDDGIDMTIEVYRGTLSKEYLGYIGDGYYYYKSVRVNIVQR